MPPGFAAAQQLQLATNCVPNCEPTGADFAAQQLQLAGNCVPNCEPAGAKGFPVRSQYHYGVGMAMPGNAPTPARQRGRGRMQDPRSLDAALAEALDMLDPEPQKHVLPPSQVLENASGNFVDFPLTALSSAAMPDTWQLTPSMSPSMSVTPREVDATQLPSRPAAPAAAHNMRAQWQVEAPASWRSGAGTLLGDGSWRVRGTFIDARPQRSPSLERFFQKRQVRSSPPSGPPSGPPSRLPSLPPSGRLEVATADVDTEFPFVMQTPTGSDDGDEVLSLCGCETPSTFAPQSDLHSCGETPPRWTQQTSGVLPPGSLAAAAICAAQTPRPRAVLRLSDAISAPGQVPIRLADELVCSGSAGGFSSQKFGCSSYCESSSASVGSAELTAEVEPARPHLVLGTPELPSRGSTLHHWGVCKPCAFMYQEGCQNGLDCQFCHLCEPGERKRRKKERLAAKREAREEARRSRLGRYAGC